MKLLWSSVAFREIADDYRDESVATCILTALRMSDVFFLPAYRGQEVRLYA